jgi:hypothetical protein
MDYLGASQRKTFGDPLLASLKNSYKYIFQICILQVPTMKGTLPACQWIGDRARLQPIMSLSLVLGGIDCNGNDVEKEHPKTENSQLDRYD